MDEDHLQGRSLVPSTEKPVYRQVEGIDSSIISRLGRSFLIFLIDLFLILSLVLFHLFWLSDVL